MTVPAMRWIEARGFRRWQTMTSDDELRDIEPTINDLDDIDLGKFIEIIQRHAVYSEEQLM